MLSAASATLSEGASSDILKYTGPRHRFEFPNEIVVEGEEARSAPRNGAGGASTVEQPPAACLLYTSDAADE